MSNKKILAAALAFSMILTLCACNVGNKDVVAPQTTEVSQAVSEPSPSKDNTKDKTSEDIHIDQVGYKTAATKVAIIKGSYSEFNIVDAKTNSVAFTKELSGKKSDEPSGDTVCYADFSEFTKDGEYYISIDKLGKSYNFKIANSVYNDASDALIKALYYQRCGGALDKQFAGDYAHVACHKGKASIYKGEGNTVDVSGGWHDAADYGRYVVPAAITAADIMLAFDFYPENFIRDVNIPESKGEYPDVLNEARYGIEWMLKMQDQETGGVYHKVSTRMFPELTTLPQDDVGELMVLPFSSTATADFAAVTAMASRIFAPIDARFAAKCLDASKLSWGWLEKNDKLISYKNPSDISTGEYGDSSDADERLWAAAELFRATDEDKYNQYFVKHFESNGLGLGWQNVSGFAAIAYMFAYSEKIDKDTIDSIRSSWIEKADVLVSTANGDGYKISLHKMEYNWGSNMNVLNHAMHLLITEKLTNEEKYTLAAEDSVHYIFGRNSLNQSFITGVGSKQVMNPHHRPSIGDTIEKPVPGLVVGGPNASFDDEVSKSKLTGKAPAKCYIDDMSAYSTNEVATYWNSPAIFVLAHMNK